MIFSRSKLLLYNKILFFLQEKNTLPLKTVTSFDNFMILARETVSQYNTILLLRETITLRHFR